MSPLCRLYGGPDSGEKSNGEDGDVMAWLRLAAASLDSKSRQALIKKLDAIAVKKSELPKISVWNHLST